MSRYLSIAAAIMNGVLTRNLARFAGIVLAGVLAAGLLLRPAHAVPILTGCGGADFGASCSLAELVGTRDTAGGSITIDDKLFDGWGFVSDASNITGVSPTSATGILVEPIGEGTLDPGPGVRFTAFGGAWSLFRDLANPAGPGTLTDTISFAVSTTDGSARIKDDTLEMTGLVNGFASVGVDEFVKTALGGPLAETNTSCFHSCDLGILFDSATFLPQSKILVTKTVTLTFSNIPITLPGEAEHAEIHTIEQRFSQIQVPEPATLALFGAGLLALGFLRRRRPARAAPPPLRQIRPRRPVGAAAPLTGRAARVQPLGIPGLSS